MRKTTGKNPVVAATLWNTLWAPHVWQDGVSRCRLLTSSENVILPCSSNCIIPPTSSYSIISRCAVSRSKPICISMSVSVCVCLCLSVCLSVYRLLLLAQRCLYSAAIRSTGQQLDSWKVSFIPQDCTNHLTQNCTRISSRFRTGTPE